MNLLVLAPEAVGAGAVRAALGDDVDDARVLVVSRTVNESPVAFWMSDSDEALADARVAGERTVESLRSDGVSATGTTGEADVLTALQDALATFPADRILVFTREDEEQRYREQDLCAEVERRFEVPVTMTTL